MPEHKTEGEATKHDQAAERNQELEHKIAVSFLAVLAPGRGDRAAIAHDTVSEHETAARVEPEQKHGNCKNEQSASDRDRDEPRRKVVHGKGLAVTLRPSVPITFIKTTPEVETTAAEKSCEPGGKPDHEPLLHVERAEE